MGVSGCIRLGRSWFPSVSLTSIFRLLTSSTEGSTLELSLFVISECQALDRSLNGAFLIQENNLILFMTIPVQLLLLSSLTAVGISSSHKSYSCLFDPAKFNDSLQHASLVISATVLDISIDPKDNQLQVMNVFYRL